MLNDRKNCVLWDICYYFRRILFSYFLKNNNSSFDTWSSRWLNHLNHFNPCESIIEDEIFEFSSRNILIERRKKVDWWNCANISRGMEIREVDSGSFFSPFTAVFLFSPLSTSRSTIGRPVQGISGCKGNRANVSRPPGAHAHASRSF